MTRRVLALDPPVPWSEPASLPRARVTTRGSADYEGMLPGLAVVGLTIAGVLGGPLVFAVGAVGAAVAAGARWALHRLPRDPVAWPLEPTVAPAMIRSPDIRHAYAMLLTTYDRVRVVLARDPRARDVVADLFARAAGLVEAGGRLAYGTNNLDFYSEHNPIAEIEGEIHVLEQRLAAASDRETALAYAHALRTRRRQLAARQQIASFQDRARARLEMATASLAMLGAVATEIGATQAEAVASPAERLAADVDALADDLEILEAVLVPAPGAAQALPAGALPPAAA